MADLQVVIPTLDEADTLPMLLGDLARQEDIRLSIRVVDGGSRDATVALAREAGARVIEAPAGRARQMNAGAAEPEADFLLFLHADSRLDRPGLLERALHKLRTAREYAHGRPVAGHFSLRFDGASPQYAALYAHMQRKSRLNRPYTINGDQGLMIHREDFARLGGFDESLPYLEDLRIAKRLFEIGTWLPLPGEIRTSARRFEAEGPRPRNLLMGMIVMMHELGDVDFLDQAPRLYAAQADTRRLDLRPFVAEVRGRLLAGGPAAAARRLWRVGRLCREQFWHLPYWIDVSRRQPVPGPALRAWDRYGAPLFNNPLGTAVGSLIAAALLFTPFLWRWAERGPPVARSG